MLKFFLTFLLEPMRSSGLCSLIRQYFGIFQLSCSVLCGQCVVLIWGKFQLLLFHIFLLLPSLFLHLWRSHYESVINFEFISQFLLMLLLPFFFSFSFLFEFEFGGTWRLTSRPRGTGKCVSIRLPPLTLRCVMTSTLEEHRAGVRVVVLVSVRPGGLRGQV